MVGALQDANPHLEVRVAFLGLSVPSLTDAVEAVARADHDRAVVVPLLLGSAFHSRVDLPALIAEAAARHPGIDLIQAPVLGDDERLVTAARDRIAAAGVGTEDPDVGVALAAVGSSSAAANAVTRTLADRVRRGTAWRRSRVCFAAAAEPSVDDAVAGLAHDGARRIVVGSWFLAPGLLTDRVRARAMDASERAAAGRAFAEPAFAEPIGAHALVPQVIADRYHYAVRVARDAGRAGAAGGRAA